MSIMRHTIQLSTADIVTWLRQQSARFAEMADEIDGTFGSLPSSSSPRRSSEPQPLTVESIVKQMDGRAMRISRLAEELHVDEDKLIAIMTPVNGFIRGARSWYTHSNGTGGAG